MDKTVTISDGRRDYFLTLNGLLVVGGEDKAHANLLPVSFQTLPLLFCFLLPSSGTCSAYLKNVVQSTKAQTLFCMVASSTSSSSRLLEIMLVCMP